MTAAFQLNADELDAAFVERVKAAFPLVPKLRAS